MSIFSAIGHFFVGIFNAAKKAYLELSQEEQIALQSGTGFVGVINSMLTATAADVRKSFAEKHPDMSEEAVEAALLELGKTFFGSTYTTGDEVIEAIQKKLTGLEGKAWATISHSLAVALSLIFAPASTKLKTITTLIEWVYQKFVKKSLDQTEQA